jgi:uncharacterized damage-inducible protein DinB
MNASAFRYLYDYHFTENRRLWNDYVAQLSHEQFVQPIQYSHGSVRDQIIHLLDVDDVWFSELHGISPLEPLPAANSEKPETIRRHWDAIELRMRDYLRDLRDDMLFDTPIKEHEEDKNLYTWQVLLHVVNHGTDHRAQILRALFDLGVKTTSQDFIFYVYKHV